MQPGAAAFPHLKVSRQDGVDAKHRHNRRKGKADAWTTKESNIPAEDAFSLVRRETSVAGGLRDVGGQTSTTSNQSQPIVALHGKSSWAGTPAVPASASGPDTAPDCPRRAGRKNTQGQRSATWTHAGLTDEQQFQLNISLKTSGWVDTPEDGDGFLLEVGKPDGAF